MEEKRREIREDMARRNEPKKRNPLIIPLMIVLCTFIWIAPSLVPGRESSVGRETLENSAKMTLYLASIRVKAYVDANRKLPLNLFQAGVDSTAIDYKPGLDLVFELSTRVQGTNIVYRSTVPDTVFLGPALRVRGIS